MLRPTLQVISIAALRRLFPQRVISRFGDVPWPPSSPDLTAPDFFSVGLLEKSVQYSPYRLTCTQRKYMGKNRQTFRRNTSSHYAHLHNSYAPVHWGGWWPLKDIVHKKWNYVKKKLSTIVNCDVLKLVSITFNKMLFLFIISSVFLPHPVFTTVLQRVNCPNNNSVQYELLTPPWNNMRNTKTVPANCTYHTMHVYIQGVPGGMCQTSGEFSLC